MCRPTTASQCVGIPQLLECIDLFQVLEYVGLLTPGVRMNSHTPGSGFTNFTWT